MADCGASGSALDQAARALVGNDRNMAHAQKQFGSLFGHAMVGQNTTTMPGARSRVHEGSGGNDTLMAASVVSAPAVHQSGLPTQHHAPGVSLAANMSRVMPNMMHGHQHQHQQHMAMAMQQQMMAIQKHQYDQMLLQQQMHSQQLHQQKQRVQTAEGTTNFAENESSNVDSEGNVRGASIEELAAAWAEAQGDAGFDTAGLGSEGNVQRATVEELAAAWAEAQEEADEGHYSSEAYETDPSYLFEENAESLEYQFKNEVVEGSTEIPNNTNFMEEGMRHFHDGNLVEAIRSFELELQVNDPDNSTAWRMLGKCHAENDQDREAILCLESAVDRDPYCAESMLALGVSYVNELNYKKALSVLKDWITMNPKYAGMDTTNMQDLYGEQGQNSGENDTAFQELQHLLLEAVEYDGSEAADVWEALGVAANVSRDFETAIESFRKALEARPNDYQLWNKLGATLANSNRSEEALPAYHKAIQLKPKYARAWLNLAISHSNLRQFDEAARCYLQTLSLNPAAVHCWSYLRVALSCSERWDLIPFAASQNLDAFREHYDFVSYESVGKPNNV